jgi:soluble lytic murein transglycosylase-like protein
MRSLAGSALVLALLVSLFSAAGLTERASAAEPDEIAAAEGSLTPSQPVSTDTICSALATAAAQNDLPTDFFARLIWQESRFDPAAVSRAGAQGVAQFMPATANWRGLSNPFDPLEAIAQSAKLLRDLRREFGNLGLAAAAYNVGSGRVRTPPGCNMRSGPGSFTLFTPNPYRPETTAPSMISAAALLPTVASR